MTKETYFVIPFVVGAAYLILILLVRGFRWIKGLSKIDKLRLFQSLLSVRALQSLNEAFREGLLHRSIFKKSLLLGYMHMSLAFGWFLLIVVGHLEAMVSRGSLSVPFYLPVFFRYFEYGNEFLFDRAFAFVMDLLLLFVLSGVLLAFLKRFKKKAFGLKKTTRLKSGDRIALLSLWFIFPLRLFAESISAALHQNGSFITSAIGGLWQNSDTLALIHTPTWLAYSITLGFFFIALPNSRYMHIPTEILFIFLRNAGINLKKKPNTYTEVQVFSCSRCGICLDNCQLSAAGINHSQSVYILKNIRNKSLDDENLFNCLLCGKCEKDCPVGIQTNTLRITQRIESTRQYNSSYTYLETGKSKKAEVVYFAGCMTHLTPGIIISMKKIFARAGVNYWFLDEEKAPCCGRPLMLAGQYEAASKLIANNSQQIIDSGAKLLVVSCPICYKVFKEDYNLSQVEIVFHAEYILSLIKAGKIHTEKSAGRLLYHDPCELGRGMGMYEFPRELIKQTGELISIEKEKQEAYCCGGSLGNLKITQAERTAIKNQAINDYLLSEPDLLITACPLCKKSFSRNSALKVKDIAELVAERLMHEKQVVEL